MRLQDPDRGKNKDVLSARIDRLAPPGSPEVLNYKLKHVVPQLLGIGMVGYSDNTPMDVLPYEQHVRYLTSDLLGTAALYDHLMARLTPGQREYNDKFIAPLTPILVEMTEVGIGLDDGFVRARVARLERLRVQLSEEHRRVLGVPLGMNQKELCSWLFGELGLYPESFKKLTARERASGRSRREPSLDSKHLAALERLYSGDPRAMNSLALIRSYRLATSLMVGLKKLLPHRDYRDGRIDDETQGYPGNRSHQQHRAPAPERQQGPEGRRGRNHQPRRTGRPGGIRILRFRCETGRREGHGAVTSPLSPATRVCTPSSSNSPGGSYFVLRLVHIWLSCRTTIIEIIGASTASSFPISIRPSPVLWGRSYAPPGAIPTPRSHPGSPGCR